MNESSSKDNFSLVITDIDNTKFLLENLQNAFEKEQGSKFLLKFIFAKKNLNDIFQKHFSEYFSGVLSMRTIIFKKMVECLSSNRTLELDLSWLLLTSEEFLKLSLAIGLCENAEIVKINLERNNISLAEDFLKSLTLLINTKTLSLEFSDTKMKDDSMIIMANSLSELKKIEKISINADNSQLTSIGVKAIVMALLKIPTINECSFSLKRIINQKDLIIELAKIFIILPNLKKIKIDLSFCHFQSEELAPITDALKTLKNIKIFELILSENIVNDVFILELGKVFENNPNLTNLNLDFSNSQAITDKSMKILGEKLKNSCSGLTSCNLNFTGAKLNDESLKFISGYLIKNKTLHQLNLDISKNLITQEGARSLLAGISSLKILKSLDLNISENRIHKSCFKGLAKLTKELLELNDLKLNLEGLILDEEGAEWLGKGLQYLKKIIILDLNLKETLISNEGIRSICKSLKSLSKIKNCKLNLNHCKIENPGANSIGKFLKWMENLRELDLDLSNNYIENEGIENITKSFKELHALKSLCFILCENSITNEGVEIIGKNLEYLSNLKILELNLLKPYEIGNNSPLLTSQSDKDTPQIKFFLDVPDAEEILSPQNLNEMKDTENPLLRTQLQKDSIVLDHRDSINMNSPPNKLDLFKRPISPSTGKSIDIRKSAVSGLNFENTSRRRGTTFHHAIESPRKSRNNKVEFLGISGLIKSLKKLKALMILDLKLEANQVDNDLLNEIALTVTGMNNLASLTLDLKRNEITLAGIRNFFTNLRKAKDLCSLNLCVEDCQEPISQESKEVVMENTESIILNNFEHFPKLDFFKDMNQFLISHKGLVTLKINGDQDFRLSKVGKFGAESLYSPFKSIFYELNIDFNKSIFSDIQSMSLFFDELSIVSRLFQNIVLNLNDVSYISNEENFEKILIENLSKIYSSANFTLHSNFFVPFHSSFWPSVFRLKEERNWNLFIYNYEMQTANIFNTKLFQPLLMEINIKSIEFNNNNYQKIVEKFPEIHKDNEKLLRLDEELDIEFSFNHNVYDFINDAKYTLSRYRELLIKICFNPSLLALISCEILDIIFGNISEESICSEFLNLIFQKSLILNVPTHLCGYILKEKKYGKLISLESMGVLFNYLNYREKTQSDLDSGLLKIDEIHNWKTQTLIELNLSDNIYLCSISCKSKLNLLILKYWQKFKLKSPKDFYTNDRFIVKDESLINFIKESNLSRYNVTILSKFYEKVQNAFKSFELDELDDKYGQLIINLISSMYNVKKIDLSGLNLGDNFCLMYSDLLINRRISRKSTAITINLSHNPRITNVGLKYLYVSFELSHSRELVNVKSAKTRLLDSSRMLYSQDISTSLNMSGNGPEIIIDLELSLFSSSSTTFILDNGLGQFIIQRIKEIYNPKMKYCHKCENEVCDKCHKLWINHKNKKCKDVIETNCEENTDRNIKECLEYEFLVKKSSAKFWIYNGLFYGLLFPVILYYFMAGITILFKKINKILQFYFQKIKNWWTNKYQNKEKVSEKNKKGFIHQITTLNIYKFVMGYETDPKDKGITKFRFNYNVHLLNEKLSETTIFIFYSLNFFLFYFVCIVSTIYMKIEAHYVYGAYALLMLIVETTMIMKIISIINKKSPSNVKQKNLMHNFSLYFYGPLLFQSQIDKYDFFTDIQFIDDLKSKTDDLSLRMANASIIILASITFFNFLQLCVFFKRFYFNKKTIGLANENINEFSILSFLVNFNGIGFCLDFLSTRNAIKIGQVYVPQVMISAISKCIFENIPQFIIQMILLGNVPINGVIIYTICSTILSLIGAIKTALTAKASILTKKFLVEKFSIEKKKKNRKSISLLEIPEEDSATRFIPENTYKVLNKNYL